MTVQDRPCMPVGPYVGRFVGAAHQDTSGPGWKPAIGRDGNPMPPGLIWSFEITEGPRAGEIADRMTGKAPTPGSTCGAMLSALFERPIRVGEELDVDSLIGTMWRFHVEEKERSAGTCVSVRGLVRARDLESRHQGNGQARTTATMKGPPPDDDEEPERDELPDVPTFWIKRVKGAEPVEVDTAGLLEFVRGGANPRKTKCCPAGFTKWIPIIDAVPEAADVVPIL